MGTEPHVAAFAELDAHTLYALLKLRVDVFVVEQESAYPELDGRDLDPGTRHVWLPDDSGAPVAYLRIVEEPGGARIGRVTTAPHARGGGLARRLMDTALRVIGDRPVRLDAQTYASGFYAGYGFTPDGPEFVEDGIPHVPMSRAGTPPSAVL
jgi:ElaA protein